MKRINNKKVYIKSEDRIKRLILSSLFACLIIFSGCGQDIEMQLVEESEYNRGTGNRSETGNKAEGENEINVDNNAWVGNGMSAASNGMSAASNSMWTVGNGMGAANDNYIQSSKNSNLSNEVYDVDKIKVHVCGQVYNSGVYEMQKGDRVCDLINKAGGLKEEALEEAVNLARELNDGEQVYIPSKEDALYEDFRNKNVEIYTSGPSKININTASEAEMLEITGVGPSKAKSIISYREKNGGFKSIEEIKNVTGIGEGTFEKIKDEITVK